MSHYLALIAGLSGLGLIPRCVLEIQTTAGRLQRIFELIKRCRSSIHDLSRTQLSSGPLRCPRFNMPFELGLAVARAQLAQYEHHWVVFESRQYRLQHSLSDLNGFDPFIHGGTVHGTLDVLMNAFISERETTTSDLMSRYRDLRKFVWTLRKHNKRASLFTPHAFRQLVIASQKIDRNRRFHAV